MPPPAVPGLKNKTRPARIPAEPQGGSCGPARIRLATNSTCFGVTVVAGTTNRTMLARRPALTAAILTAAVLTAQAEDWPQFRGPTGQGHSTERGLPLEWSETRNVAWKSALTGTGWSSPSVSAGRVWLTEVREAAGRGNRGSNLSLRALAFDAATGRQVVDAEVFRIDSSRPLHPK